MGGIIGTMGKHPDFSNFLWVVIHFIAVIYCILNSANYFREDWYWP